MKFTPIAALVMSSLAAFAQSASAQTGAEGRMNFLRDSRAATSGPQFEFSRLQYGPLPIAGSRVASTAGPLQEAERGDAKAREEGEVLFRDYGVSGIAVFNLSRFAEAGDMLRAMPRTVPLGRFGNEAEVSAAITFLLSPAASFISGTTLRVDGARPQVRMGWPQRPPGATAAAHPAVRPFDGFHRAQVPQVFAPSHTPKTEAA